MGSETHSAVLNPSQLRAVGATLGLVEHAMEEVERLLTGPATGLTFRFVEGLDAEDRRSIQTKCERVRAVVSNACVRLGLELVDRSRRQEIQGEVSVLWAMLEDTRSTALQGYGPLSPETGTVVDGMVDEVSGNLLGILRVIAGWHPRKGAVQD